MRLGGLEIRRLIAVMAVGSLFIALTLGCAAGSHPRSPRPGVYRFKISREDWTELYKGEGFLILKGPWFDPDYFQRTQDEIMELLRSHGYPVDADQASIQQTRMETRGLEIYMQAETNERRASFLVLGMLIDDDLKVLFRGPGAFILSSEADTVVADRGLLLCPERVHGRYYDTARQQVALTREYDGRPDYSERPNLIFVRLPAELYEHDFTSLHLDERVIEFVRSRHQ